MVRKLFLGLGVFLLSVIVGLVIYNVILSVKYKDAIFTASLAEKELNELTFVNQFKQKWGDEIWPEFGTKNIPIVLFNDKYSFLSNSHAVDSSWTKTPEQPLEGLTIYRKSAVDPQAFAIPVGDDWAASLGMQDEMNRQMFLGIRNEIPVAFKFVLPYFLISIKDDVHFASLFHEMFHAFQAKMHEEKFLACEASHRYLKDYPYKNDRFRKLWNKEGRLLKKALESQELAVRRVYADSFLSVRAQRRALAALSDHHLKTEKQLEWLEGLAKYAEYSAYIIALEKDNDRINFKAKNAYWQIEKKQRLKALGESGGDNRFYYSGMAMAFLLDDLYPNWKSAVFEENIYLDDLLNRAMGKNSEL
jgi:hypothetical protein